MGIHCDEIEADLMYQGQRLGTKEIPAGFYLGHKKANTNVKVVLRGEHLLRLINGDEKLVYESEIKAGVYNIGLKLKLASRSKALSINRSTRTYEIICNDLEVPLSSEGNASSATFDSTKCSYKQFSDESSDWFIYY